MLMLSGEPMPRVLMQVVRFCINTDDHELKKVIMLYWEVVPKYDPSRKLLPEMILVCNALRNDLNHPNEYVRGCMLRFLCKIKEPEILEPLVPSIKQCLDHRHSYVRKNAALATFHVCKHFGATLMPDGNEVMERFVLAESELGARRNAYLMLFNEAEEVAIDFLAQNIDDLGKFGDGFALLVLELTRKVCRRDPQQKSRFVRVLFSLLQSPSAAVSYEAAWTLVSLSSAPTAVRAAASTYAQLLNAQSDNNVKLIVLERLDDLKQHHARVLQEVLMDILRALSSPNIDICAKTLSVAMELVSPRNIEEVVSVLKREVVRTRESELEKGTAYRAMLVRAIHGCATKFATVAESVVAVLMDFLGGDGAMDVIVFARAIVEQYPQLRPGVLVKLLANFGDISAAPTLAVGLWIVSEYCEGEMLEQAVDELDAALGEPPFLLAPAPKPADVEAEAAAAAAASAAATAGKSVVLADGTYATQSTVAAEVPASAAEAVAPLRKLIAEGDAFLGTVAATAYTKLALRAVAEHGEGAPLAKRLQVRALKTICGVSKLVAVPPVGAGVRAAHSGAHADCAERLAQCARVLLEPRDRALLLPVFVGACRESFARYLAQAKPADGPGAAGDADEKGAPLKAQADDLISWRQLRRGGAAGADVDLYEGDDLSRATGAGAGEDFGARLSHVYQLSGFADPVYAEACVAVHDYDIVLEILVINRTPSTLTNLTVELATMGDLKLVERPQPLTIGPLDQRTIRANIKVSSTETGHIFGTIVYENSSTAEKTYINLNNIHLDIMDYIRPATCSDEAFRSMWAEFEWENKVAVNTSITDLSDFLAHVVAQTNMSCLTPQTARDGASTFLAANLYAKSIFGEDAHVYVSVEKKDDVDGKLIGYIRIRSKTQGIALSLGDRITSVQRGAGVP